MLRIAERGIYTFILRERPEIGGFPLTAAEARLRIGEIFDETKQVVKGATEVRFKAKLEPDDTEIMTWLMEEDGTSRGAYFVEVFRMDE